MPSKKTVRFGDGHRLVCWDFEDIRPPDVTIECGDDSLDIDEDKAREIIDLLVLAYPALRPGAQAESPTTEEPR
jgi:hypothetical protein